MPASAPAKSSSPASSLDRDSPVAPPYSPITPVLHNSVPEKSQPPIPISVSTNPDAIALRSAISVLQLQRMRTLNDLQTLEHQKSLATRNPEAFTRAFASGKIKSASSDELLDPHTSDDAGNEHEDDMSQGFGTIPGPQTVVRCPPVEWSKYHVLGEALEDIHEENKQKPHSSTLSRATHVVAATYSPWADSFADAALGTPTKAKDV